LQRYDIFSKVSICFSFIRALLTVIFLAKGYSIVALALIQLAINLSTNIVILIISKKMLKFTLWDKLNRKKRLARKTIINYSFFVLLNTIGYQAALYSSNFIIASFLPIASVTYYAIAGTLVDYIKKIVVSGNQVFSPLTSQLDAQNDIDKIRTLFLKGTKFMLVIGLPISIVFIFMGKQFIGLWMGQAYSNITGNILAILTVMTLFSLPFFTITSVLLGISKHHITAYCRVIEAFVTIGLSVILIKQFGLIGVALGNAIPDMIISLFVLPIIIKKILGIRFSEYLRISWYGPLMAVVPFAVGCFLMNKYYASTSLLEFFSKIIFLLLIYLAGIWFGALTSEEKDLCKRKFFTMAITS
jgi:O-antigen/teichoic acid export membrane protein